MPLFGAKKQCLYLILKTYIIEEYFRDETNLLFILHFHSIHKVITEVNGKSKHVLIIKKHNFP